MDRRDRLTANPFRAGRAASLSRRAVLPLLLAPLLAPAFRAQAQTTAQTNAQIQADGQGAVLTAEDSAALERIAAAVNEVRTLKARFQQIAPDGSVTAGQFLMQRPGRMRFDYDAPTPILIVADGTWLTLVDQEVDQVTRFPLGETPIGMLVRDRLSFTDATIQVLEVVREPGATTVVVTDPRNRDEGHIAMVFTDDPVGLREWRVTDSQNLQTVVALSDVELNIAIDFRQFIVRERTDVRPDR
ncbi:LolA family protein [Zavarzinia sp. CC-PAN008]|uniref:LolA family protein n=1 Tax=Zavarzinia sp. CC-PAN008 TaxID=3243332 RepID=UPI003F746D26